MPPHVQYSLCPTLWMLSFNLIWFINKTTSTDLKIKTCEQFSAVSLHLSQTHSLGLFMEMEKKISVMGSV